MERHREYSITRMARIFKVSRAGFYSYLSRGKSTRRTEDENLSRIIRKIHSEHRGVYGVDRIHQALRRRGLRCGRKRVWRLMRSADISGKRRRKFRRTTDSNHGSQPSPNLVRRRFRATRPNQLWVSDITFVRLRTGWLYVCLIMDIHSRRIVGWSMKNTLAAHLATSALQMAIENREPEPGMIFHSDRGSQYVATEFRALLRRHGMRQSMSRRGDCWDNACAESLFATLKRELTSIYFNNASEARREIFSYIETFYNRTRSHSALGYMSPEQFEKAMAA